MRLPELRQPTGPALSAGSVLRCMLAECNSASRKDSGSEIKVPAPGMICQARKGALVQWGWLFDRFCCNGLLNVLDLAAVERSSVTASSLPSSRMPVMKKIAAVVSVIALLAVTAVKADQTEDVKQMHEAYQQSMGAMKDDMHHGMMSDDPDVAFAAGMLPHHEGAVEMAKIELKYGKDPEMLELARKIVAAQAAEIAQMKAWLKAHPAK